MRANSRVQSYVLIYCCLCIQCIVYEVLLSIHDVYAINTNIACRPQCTLNNHMPSILGYHIMTGKGVIFFFFFFLPGHTLSSPSRAHEHIYPLTTHTIPDPCTNTLSQIPARTHHPKPLHAHMSTCSNLIIYPCQ